MNYLKSVLLSLSIAYLAGCGALQPSDSEVKFTSFNSILQGVSSEQNLDIGVDEFDLTDEVLIPEDLEFKSEVLKKCQAGEIDIIRLAMHCQPNQNLILTMKDTLSEKLIKDFGSADQVKIEVAINKLKNLDAMNKLTGSNMNLFLCLDSDSDKSCADERVMDLNEMNGDLIYSVLAFAKIKKGKDTQKHKTALAKICDNETLQKLNDGLVIYHQMFDSISTSPQSVTTSGVKRNKKSKRLNVHGLTADKMAEYVKNFSQTDDAISFESGTSVIFTLVEADKESCDDIGIRIHGCYIKGTQIRVSKTVEIPIEDLKVGNSILRANGTSSKITRIVRGAEKNPVIELHLDNGQKTLTLTENHPVVTKQGLKKAKELIIGTELQTLSGKWHKIAKIRNHKYTDLVYNIELEGKTDKDHYLVSNDIITGDLFLQNKLIHEKKSNITIGSTK